MRLCEKNSKFQPTRHMPQQKTLRHQKKPHSPPEVKRQNAYQNRRRGGEGGGGGDESPKASDLISKSRAFIRDF